MIDLLGWIVAGALVALTVTIHYQTMQVVSDIILPWATRRLHGRRVMILVMFSLLAGHIIEIWLFALSMMGFLHIQGFGSLTGEFDGDLHAFLYFSATNYTAIGNGNIHPLGAIRSVIVSETLAGLMMIAWSASFAYLKMEEIWKGHKKH